MPRFKCLTISGTTTRPRNTGIYRYRNPNIRPIEQGESFFASSYLFGIRGVNIPNKTKIPDPDGGGEVYSIPVEFTDDFDEVLRLIEDLEYEEAKSTASRLLERNPDHPRLLVLYARVLFHSRKSDTVEDTVNVERTLLKAIEVAPDLSEAHSLVGRLYQLTGRDAEARKHVNIAVHLDAKSAENWNAIGLYYATQGELQRALDFFTAAYSLDSECYVAAYNASCMNAKLGRIEDALKYLGFVKSKRLLHGTETDPDFDEIRGLAEFRKTIYDNLNGLNSDV